MKDPLEYTPEELKSLSTAELEELRLAAIDMAEKYHTEQLTKKILINALYGATGNKFFPLYNKEFASGITANGRIFIQQTANMLRERLQQLIPWDREYISYGDTDSCLGSTLIETTQGALKISEIYDNSEADEIEYSSGKFVREVKNLGALSVSETGTLEYKPIKYVMRHRVKKKLFKIKCSGREVTITGDHSVVVRRDGKLTEVKPAQIQKNDKLVVIGAE